MFWHRDTVDVCLDHGIVSSECVGDFGCADVFCFPAECVTDAVDEPPAPFRIAAQQIARAEVCVSLCANVANDLAVCGGGVVEVALELLRYVGGV